MSYTTYNTILTIILVYSALLLHGDKETIFADKFGNNIIVAQSLEIVQQLCAKKYVVWK